MGTGRPQAFGSRPPGRPASATNRYIETSRFGHVRLDERRRSRSGTSDVSGGRRMACDRCHSVGSVEQPDNAVLLDITHGFGSQRFPFVGCDISNTDYSCDEATDTVTYQLDAIQTRTGDPLVVVGHDHPNRSRPLTLKEIASMREILVPEAAPYRTLIPDGAATDPTWPKAQQLE